MITNKYETYLGKDFCTEEKLSDLISIMEEGSASTVSEAIKVYKEMTDDDRHRSKPFRCILPFV